MGGLSPEAEQGSELGAALYRGRVASPADRAADGALQPAPSLHTLQGPITGQVLISWGRARESESETSAERAACDSNKGLMFLV